MTKKQETHSRTVVMIVKMQTTPKNAMTFVTAFIIRENLSVTVLKNLEEQKIRHRNNLTGYLSMKKKFWAF